MTQSYFNKFIESEGDAKTRQAPGNAKTGIEENIFCFKKNHGILYDFPPTHKANIIICLSSTSFLLTFHIRFLDKLISLIIRLI